MDNELYKQRIQIGDLVDVFYDDEQIMGAVVIRTPAGAGDLWQVKSPDGAIIAINPYFYKFDCIMKKEK